MDYKTFWIIVLIISVLTVIIFELISLNNKLCTASATNIGIVSGTGFTIGDNSKTNNN